VNPLIDVIDAFVDPSDPQAVKQLTAIKEALKKVKGKQASTDNLDSPESMSAHSGNKGSTNNVNDIRSVMGLAFNK
jgi:hypothetical protein